MKTFQASAMIEAAPEAVWAILTDAAAYPQFDPNCERIEGAIKSGETIKAFTKLAPGQAFPVKVSEFVPAQKMAWSSGMPFGLFKGERSFVLKPAAGGATEFTVKEVFSGPMMALIGGSIPDMTEPFRQFVAGLKQRAEADRV
ncbi:MAG: SRPBCC family protein [Candidatus Sericytochromatia bacterium]